MPEDLSQNIAPQPEIKEEITSLGITPLSGKSKKLKISLAILGLFFILASIPVAVYLVQQGQEIRKEAEEEVNWDISCYPKVSFSDLPSTNPYYEAVTCLNGPPYCCIAGYPDQTFKPYQAITRAETVTFITSYHIWVRKDWEWQIPSQPSFPDLPYAHWSFPFIETAKHYGFISGYPDGTFKPDEPWCYGFHGIDKGDYDFTQECSTITRGDFIQGLYDYGMGRGELDECLEAELLTCVDLAGTPDPSGLSKGDKITLTCKGTSDPDPINHLEFRVSIDAGTPTALPNAPATKTDSEYKGEIEYTIPDYGCYKIECRACVSTDSSNCTAWGQAQ